MVRDIKVETLSTRKMQKLGFCVLLGDIVQPTVIPSESMSSKSEPRRAAPHGYHQQCVVIHPGLSGRSVCGVLGSCHRARTDGHGPSVTLKFPGASDG